MNSEYIYSCFDIINYHNGYIMTLGVANSHRRKGIASKMLQETEEFMHGKHDCKILSLHCKEDNER